MTAELPVSDGDKLRLLADLHDAQDASRGVTDHEVQDDLRRMADILDVARDPEWMHLAIYLGHVNDSPRGGPAITYWRQMVNRLLDAVEAQR